MSDQDPIAELPEWLTSQIIQEGTAPRSQVHAWDFAQVPVPRRPGVASWVAKLAESEPFRAALEELGWQPPAEPGPPEFLDAHDARAYFESRPRCADGARCHHGCAQGDGKCFRVGHGGPLSGVYPGDEWPADVRQANAPDNGSYDRTPGES